MARSQSNHLMKAQKWDNTILEDKNPLKVVKLPDLKNKINEYFKLEK